MRLFRSLVLYAALALGANTATADVGKLMELSTGDLAKISWLAEPEQVSDVAFKDAAGNDLTMKAYEGQYVLLNFWALWCAPCREEMPALDRLDAALSGEGFEVVTIATGRNSPMGVDNFFQEENLTSLPKLYDARMAMAREFGALGLPVSVLIGPDGKEVGRAHGAVHWDSDAAINLFRAWMAQG